jgi:hypothetical protein
LWLGRWIWKLKSLVGLWALEPPVGVELLLPKDLLEELDITERVITRNPVDLLEAVSARLVIRKFVSHIMELLNEELYCRWHHLLIELWVEDFPAGGFKIVIDAVASLCHILSKLVDEVSEHNRPFILEV